MKRFIYLLLIFSIFMPSGNLIASEEKLEFSLAIKKAELSIPDLVSFSLKKDYILSLDQSMLTNLHVLKKVNLIFSENSNFWKGALKGALIGGAAGIFLGLFSGDSDDSGGFVPKFSPLFKAIVLGAAGALIGAVIGGIAEVIS